MNDYKTKKLAEFDNNFVDGNHCSQMNENKNINDIKQFIFDLIDEMESNTFLKDIVTKTRIDTLRQVLPTECIRGNEGDNDLDIGYNDCRQNIIDKAKEIWGIELNNLNK